jgi:heme o synthase
VDPRGPRGRGVAIAASPLNARGAAAGQDAVAAKLSGILLVKPGIVGAVTLAGFAGMVLAQRGLPDPAAVFVTLVCILAAAAGSAVLNTVLDERLDAKMPRLSRRVDALRAFDRRGVAAGAVVAVAGAVALSAYRLNLVVSALLAAAAVGYSLLYTLVWKRRSPYGTVPGAVPGAVPVLIGYAAVKPALGADGVILFLFLVLWQPPHFWALALRHREEYRSAGVPVLPVTFGEPFTKVLIFLYAGALLPLSLSLWALGYLSPRFGWAALLLGSGFLATYYHDTVATQRYGRAFAASIVYLVLVLAALVADIFIS